MSYDTSQDEPPSERKIAKLCEYAAKNPFRIPKVSFLSFHFTHVKVQEREKENKMNILQLIESIAEC